MRNAFLARQIGTTADVLVETADAVRGELSGRSGNYAEVIFPGAPSDVGEIHRVSVETVRGGRLAGTRS
jgi:tRNA A37 methylthiotransferase MiaB